ncbi:MAG TPA: hypothetical protein DHW61_03165 [Lachnoclostridium phytofermentans]|uniref:Uncharacterized protein n=1 Tax=Lachnoclostridium phytofermentans TaxID=66219 RepID=A0A3D2X354_9FIRM|nr:hypothetical protein [Lachnoclostridium phytofermentans]
MFYTKIKKRNLLLLASVVWLLAGFNILRIGIISYKDNLTIINLFISIVIFILFWFMVFGKLVQKHTYRIINYNEEKPFFLKFFDIKSFFIMAFMISFGIGIRLSNIFPDLYIAVFYSGLGAALFLAGILFGYNYFTQRTEK